MANKSRGRRAPPAGPSANDLFGAELEELARQPISSLRRRWRECLGTEPPSVRSRDIMLGLLAWNIQAKAFGGLDGATERKLREIAQALERDGAYEPKLRRRLSPGVVVTREWKGAIHKVSIAPDGFDYGGKRFKSLSEVARVITGTRWSGPRFFGLEQKAARRGLRAAP